MCSRSVILLLCCSVSVGATSRNSFVLSFQTALAGQQHASTFASLRNSLCSYSRTLIGFVWSCRDRGVVVCLNLDVLDRDNRQYGPAKHNSHGVRDWQRNISAVRIVV
jgi:hypothetical protein